MKSILKWDKSCIVRNALLVLCLPQLTHGMISDWICILVFCSSSPKRGTVRRNIHCWDVMWLLFQTWRRKDRPSKTCRRTCTSPCACQISASSWVAITLWQAETRRWPTLVQAVAAAILPPLLPLHLPATRPVICMMVSTHTVCFYSHVRLPY